MFLLERLKLHVVYDGGSRAPSGILKKASPSLAADRGQGRVYSSAETSHHTAQRDRRTWNRPAAQLVYANGVPQHTALNLRQLISIALKVNPQAPGPTTAPLFLLQVNIRYGVISVKDLSAEVDRMD